MDSSVDEVSTIVRDRGDHQNDRLVRILRRPDHQSDHREDHQTSHRPTHRFVQIVADADDVTRLL